MTGVACSSHAPVLADAVQRCHGTGDDLWRQAHEAQGFIEFLTSGESPADKLSERCQPLCVVILLVEEQPTIGHDGVKVLAIRIGEKDA